MGPESEAVDKHPQASLRAWGAFVVAGLAFLAYALCAAPAPYFLDSAELAAATFGLGVAHPPGEVTALLWGKFFDLLRWATSPFALRSRKGWPGRWRPSWSTP